MREALRISALAKKTGVRSTTLRYWERLGLLPRAARTHTGYRLFGNEAVHYVEFVRKSKEVGLSLRQMRRVLELARAGQSPCAEVERWIERKLQSLETQIQSLRELQHRLRGICESRKKTQVQRDNSKELCCLIAGLPEARFFRKNESHAKNLLC
jgi:MerR family copper efflux transcriptional regulator